MADYYTLFSTVVDGLSSDEMDWFKSVLDQADLDDEGSPEALKVARDLGIADDELTGYWPGFGWDYGQNEIYLYSEEGLDMDHLSALMAAFIKKFRPDYIFGCEFANTCSSRRADGFGGHWLVVSKAGAFSGSTATMVDNMMGALKNGVTVKPDSVLATWKALDCDPACCDKPDPRDVTIMGNDIKVCHNCKKEL